MTESDGLTYRAAGVDIAAGEELVRRIMPAAKATRRPGVIGGLGGFGGLFDLKACGYTDPVLVSSTDGVGTKLLLAQELDRHDSIGIDLVAMCVNDVVVLGAAPLFFLDYFATGVLAVESASAVVASVARGCAEAGCALLGGETAEMPGMYAPRHYDLAGFCVGAVERACLIDGSRVSAGDVLLGLASNGVHSNGYSLVRAILARGRHGLDKPFGATTLGDALLAPTRIYVQSLLKLFASVEVRAAAHITGGGLTENLPRVIPAGLAVEIDLTRIELPSIFAWLRETGSIAEREMLTTFNCGIGMVLIVAAHDVDRARAVLHACGEQVTAMGQVIAATPGVHYRGRLA
jgi:phosphoribosylformylglycinamidine cyclo-ligase